MVLNLGSIHPQGFVESVSGVRQAEVKNSKTIFKNTSKYSLSCVFFVCVKFMFCWFCSLNTVILCATDAWLILCTNKIYTYVLKKSSFFPITKGLVNAPMKLAGFSTSNKVKNHWSRQMCIIRYNSVLTKHNTLLNLYSEKRWQRPTTTNNEIVGFCSLNTVILYAIDAWFILCTNKIYTYV